MKFARYLEETQVPEWKKAYIDYRGLKKRISAIKAERDAKRTSPKLYDSVRKTPKGKDRAESTSVASPIPNSTGIRQRSDTVNIESNRAGKGTSFQESGGLSNRNTSGRIGASVEGVYGTFGHTPSINEQMNLQDGPPDLTLPPPIKSISDIHVNQALQGGSSHNRPRAMTVDTLHPGHAAVSPAFDGRSSLQPGSPKTPRRPRLLASLTGLRQRANSASTSTRHMTTLSEALAIMTPLECQFFEALDKELRKVVDFYREREKEALVRVSVIKEQLDDLKDHRKIFRAYEDQQVMPILPKVLGKLAIHLSPPMPWKQPISSNNEDAPAPSTSRNTAGRSSSQPAKYDPDDYQEAKKKLKKAVLEFYRGIEYLHNYRILNLTGFRKALKKFDKVTQAQTSQLYHNEKIEPSILSSPTTIDKMLEEIEGLYASRFEGGDRKKARSRLRANFKERSHHYSTFRTGMFIGLSIPALISGIYESFQPYMRERVPQWSSLLQIYLAFFIPVVFGLLVSLNIIVWAHVRINYIFIFELDVRTVVDSREYAELPAFLLMTLVYAFWFSFSGLKLAVAPTVWPLAWFVLAIVIFANPLPVFYPHSRNWLLRKSGALLLSGTRRVEFQDFFLGDQYCSMAYTLTSLYWMGCLYQSNWALPWGRCELPVWPLPWILATLPSWVRFVQCIRRYLDSAQNLHLVNGGKYCSSIVYYALYYNWRNRGSHYDKSFAVWILFAVIMSVYTTSWDFLMDWSLMQRDSYYRFLRKDLIYTNHIWVYYFAMFTNLLIRFGWVIYVPPHGPHPNVRSGILGVVEALRRFQWNFFRLENEHLGNADQYRVTREVPLPYAIDPAELSDDERDEDDPVRSRISSRSPLRLSNLKHSPRSPRNASENAK